LKTRETDNDWHSIMLRKR